ncbi:DUF58 domain-containing protein [Bacillus tamaricis]|uniref:DUF58 domain-containing protein n=2 Tax=Evansella tamaricis TaxID=2069301 RepID=A0ABS6JA00_9BACI|nr:DUF58 domain-containing protein [Evansella tamaricis]
MNLWDRFLFRDRGIIPTKKLVILLGIWSVLLIILSFTEVSWIILISSSIAVLFLSMTDLMFSPNKKSIAMKRIVPNEMERGMTYTVTIEMENDSNHPIRYRIVDGIPQSFQNPFPMNGEMNKGSFIHSYETSAPIRGNYAMNKLYFRYSSTLGLWEKQATFHQEDQVKVIPDLTSTREYLESAQKYLLHEGMKIRKNKSGVGEFSKIRNYVVGDDPRKINWRQTAKLQEVMTNEYEPEHGKYITILIDCGRMMGAELKDSNRLERVLEAALTVALAALQKGDYVSVIAFSKEVHVYVPPGKGMSHHQNILNAVYDIQVTPAESNYGAILNYLETVQKKRSLLLLFSDVRTFLHEETALYYLKRLRQRHLFLVIGIEDETLLERTKEKPEDVLSTMIKSMAQQQQLIKKSEKARWEKEGLQMLEARSEKLASTAVSYYIEIMNRGLL